jgi:protoheme IX farnesyltransferase
VKPSGLAEAVPISQVCAAADAGIPPEVSRALSRRLRAYVELAKPRLTALILVVAAAGYWLACRGEPDAGRLAGAAAGVTLLAAGIFALNQYLERDLDSRMRRTERRPLPAGRLSAREALWFGGLMSAAAVICLTFAVNALCGALALITFSSYLFVYTPLKLRTPHCTLIGALPGAMPPLYGWAAARGELGLEAWVLFAILFLWQFPHFHSIAWLYREDYARADIRMWSVVEPDGKTLGRQIIAFSALLVPASALPAALGMSGPLYFWGALALGGLLLWLGLEAARRKSNSEARRLLVASVLYLPALFALMVLDK